MIVIWLTSAVQRTPCTTKWNTKQYILYKFIKKPIRMADRVHSELLFSYWEFIISHWIQIQHIQSSDPLNVSYNWNYTAQWVLRFLKMCLIAHFSTFLKNVSKQFISIKSKMSIHLLRRSIHRWVKYIINILIMCRINTARHYVLNLF